MLRKLGFMTRCVLQDCIIAAVFHHRLAVIRNTTFPYNGLAARRALYEFAANDLPSSFKNAGVCEILTQPNGPARHCFGAGNGARPIARRLLIPLAGWRAIFWVQVPLAALALIMAISVLPADTGKGRTISASLWSVMNRSLVPNLILNILVAAVMMTTLVVGPFYLGLGLAMTATKVGLVMMIGPVISIVSGVPSGRLVDTWGSHRVLVIGLLLLTTGTLLLAFVPNMIGVTGYVCCPSSY